MADTRYQYADFAFAYDRACGFRGINIRTNSLQYALGYYIAYVSLSLLICTSHIYTN